MRKLLLVVFACAFVYGGYLSGKEDGKKEGLVEGLNQGQLRACEQAIRGHANMLAQFGMSILGKVECRIDNGEVVFDETVGPNEKMTFGLDLSRRH